MKQYGKLCLCKGIFLGYLNRRELIELILRKKIDFIFGKNNKLYQTGKAYLQFQWTLKQNGGQFENKNTDIIGLINHAIAHFFEEATIMTNGRWEIERMKHVIPISTFVRVLRSKDDDFSSHFDKIDENINSNKSFKEILFDNQTKQNSERKIVANYQWKAFLDFFLLYENNKRHMFSYNFYNKCFVKYCFHQTSRSYNQQYNFHQVTCLCNNFPPNSRKTNIIQRIVLKQFYSIFWLLDYR